MRGNLGNFREILGKFREIPEENGRDNFFDSAGVFLFLLSWRYKFALDMPPSFTQKRSEGMEFSLTRCTHHD